MMVNIAEKVPLRSERLYLGADHLTGHQEFFFLAIWWAGYFFPSSFLCRIFFPQKRVMCLHIQNVFTLTLWSLQ